MEEEKPTSVERPMRETYGPDLSEPAGLEHDPQVELESLQQSFSAFHAIALEADGTYMVVAPAFHSLDEPGLSVGTAKKSFSDWSEARNYYLETRNRRDYPDEAVFEFSTGEMTHRFMALERFGRKLHLSDEPSEISEETKRRLDFDARNHPTDSSAATYAKTVETPGWSSEVFNFVAEYAKTTEGADMVERLGVHNLHLLTPQQAVAMSLEVVTRLKKYNLDDMETENGEGEADQSGVLALLEQGLREGDDADFKGNGVCRNFASGVKAVFEALKDNQTKFNYLNDTYAFYEDGPRSDFDPVYEPATLNNSVSTVIAPRVGHAWNSFVTISPEGTSQSIADATWSTIDYDTGKPVGLDYTLQRMEREVYRNFQDGETGLDANETTSFYLYLIDSLPEQEGLVLDDETVARVRETDLYRAQIDSARGRYPGLSLGQYDEYALKVYKRIADQRGLDSKTQFYATRLLGAVKSHEAVVSEENATELVRLAARTKKDIGYSEVRTVFALPTALPEDRRAVVRKYVKAWERTSETSYVPVGDLRFADPRIQQLVLEFCSPETRHELETEGR